MNDTGRRLLAEFTGCAFLLIAIVGSGITSSIDGHESTSLFSHAVVVGVTLAALIVALGTVSGAHFNPGVTIASVVLGYLPRTLVARYIIAQITGAITGVGLANWMFGEPVLAIATFERTGIDLAVSEVVVTLGLILVIIGTIRSAPMMVAPVVGCYITAAIMFAPSTAFANPAVTIGRMWTDTFTGIAPGGAPFFLLAQIVGTGLAIGLLTYLFPRPAVAETSASRDDVVIESRGFTK